MTTQNRVWIELEMPFTDDKIDHELGHARAKLATNLIQRLGADPAHNQNFWWWPEKLTYCYSRYGHGGYVTLSDCGEWFNLDFFGRELGE